MDELIILMYLVFFVGTLSFSFLINLILLRFFRKLGVKNQNNNERWAKEVKPAIGGISFYIIFLLSLALFPQVFETGYVFFDLKTVGVVLACTAGFLVGLTDDAYHTRPIYKSLTQVAVGILLMFTGTQIHLFGIDILDKAITLLWVLGIMNSINMLDNMDGITGVVSLSIGLTLLSLFFRYENFTNIYFILTTGLVSTLISFLYFNWHPSKMYMGDSGSQFLGAILAILGIEFFWNSNVMMVGESSIPKQLLVPLLAFLIPLVDTTTVVINRISNGTSPFVGGKDHTTHHLARIGLSDKNVARVIFVLCIISSSLVYYAFSVKNWSYLLYTIYTLYILGVFVFLFSWC